MEKRSFGNTGLDVSRLTFGCGAVGGLMTKGDAADQDRAIAWARDNGINFFDTAAAYGNGTSEANLGRALNGNTDGIVVSTKVGLNNDDLTDIAGAVARSLDASLTRLKLDHVDIFQLHNTLGRPDFRGTLNVDQVLDDVIPAFEKLKDAGKTRFLGFTAKGDADDLHKLVKCGAFSSAQVFYNLLVPSAGATRSGWRQSIPLARRPTMRRTCGAPVSSSRWLRLVMRQACRNWRYATSFPIRRSRQPRLVSRLWKNCSRRPRP